MNTMRLTKVLLLFLFIGMFGGAYLLRNFRPLPSDSVAPWVRRCQRFSVNSTDWHACWRSFVVALVAHGGVSYALKTISDTKHYDSAFAASCHEFTHAVGEAAYLQYIKGKLTIGDGDLTTCSQGFYHGFLQELVSHSKDLSSVSAFCDARRFGITDAQKASAWRRPCFHGIGHGLSYFYGVGGKMDEKEIASRSVVLCERTSQADSAMVKECVDGAYGGIANFYFTIHGLSYTMNVSDPFWFCADQPIAYQKYCYNALVAPLYRLTGNDFAKTAHAIAAISDKPSRVLATEQLGWMPSYSGFKGMTEHEHVITMCLMLDRELADPCLTGVAKSLVMTGSVWQGMERAIWVCKTKLLSSSEQEKCAATAASQIRSIYGQEKENIYLSRWEQSP